MSEMTQDSWFRRKRVKKEGGIWRAGRTGQRRKRAHVHGQQRCGDRGGGEGGRGYGGINDNGEIQQHEPQKMEERRNNYYTSMGVNAFWVTVTTRIRHLHISFQETKFNTEMSLATLWITSGCCLCVCVFFTPWPLTPKRARSLRKMTKSVLFYFINFDRTEKQWNVEISGQ